MRPEVRHRTLQLLGVEVRAVKRPRDGDGDGFYDPDGKGPQKDRTPVAPRLPAPPDHSTIANHVKHWHADLTGMDDLLDAAASGTQPVDLLAYDSHGDTKAARVDFGNGSQGVVTRYLGTDDRDFEDQADADVLSSILARAIDIPAPRRLRIQDDRSVGDHIEGPTWAEQGQPDVATNRALQLGVLDLLLGIDARDPATLVDGPDGLVPVQNGEAFPDARLPRPGQRPKRMKPIEQIAARIDAAGPAGLSRSDVTAGLSSTITASKRDELLAELVASGAYALVPSSTGNKGHGAKYIRVEDASPPPFARRAGMEPPDLPGGPAFWRPFVADGEWAYNPLTRADVEWLRERLRSVTLRLKFMHLGRDHWWQFAMDRLDQMAPKADGARDVFADWRLYDPSIGP